MYKHLSRKERYQIHSFLKAKQTNCEIAGLLGRQRSCISRELTEAGACFGYRAEQACHKASDRAQCSRNAERVNAKLMAFAQYKATAQLIYQALRACEPLPCTTLQP
jgi:IS30 family transposase